MKKSLQEFDKNNYKLAHKRYRINLKRKTKKYDAQVKESQSQTIGSSIRIKAPSFLTILDIKFSTTLTQTLDFKNKIDKYVGKRNCILDFSDTIHFSASAQLIIYSSVQKALKENVGNGKVASIAWSNQPRINKIIQRMPLDKLCKQNGDVRINFVDNRNRLQIVYGTSNQHIDDIIDFIQKWVYRNSMDSETEYRFGDAVSETINNVSSHAYPDLELNEKKWWLICDVIGDQLYLAIYDAGVGIPATVVKKKWFWQSCESLYPELTNEINQRYPDEKLTFFTRTKAKDAQLINLSMKGDVSGTKIDKRGQGSKSIRGFVEDTETGKLQICSSKGLYIFEDSNKDINLYQLKEEIPGTLIQWNIKIDAD